MNALTDAEYVKVCDYFNGQVQSRVGSVCQTNKMKVVSANKIDCAAIGQQLSGSACTATVGDVERCAQKLDACALLGTTPAECTAISACLQ